METIDDFSVSMLRELAKVNNKHAFLLLENNFLLSDELRTFSHKECKDPYNKLLNFCEYLKRHKTTEASGKKLVKNLETFLSSDAFCFDFKLCLSIAQCYISLSLSKTVLYILRKIRTHLHLTRRQRIDLSLTEVFLEKDSRNIYSFCIDNLAFYEKEERIELVLLLVNLLRSCKEPTKDVCRLLDTIYNSSENEKINGFVYFVYAAVCYEDKQNDTSYRHEDFSKALELLKEFKDSEVFYIKIKDVLARINALSK